MNAKYNRTKNILEEQPEFRSLEKMPHFRNKISGYECALWDLKMIAKELFHIELPKVESSSFNNETS